MSYATPQDLLNRYDARRIGDLINDDGTRANSTQITASAIVQVALDDAAGMMDSEALAGGRYQPSDFATLQSAAQLAGPNTPAASDWNLVVRLNCDLAYGYLVGRRGYSRTETLSMAPYFEEALGILARLREGDLVFNVARVIAAQVPAVDTLSSQITLISSNMRVFGDLANFPTQAPDWPFNHPPD